MLKGFLNKIKYYSIVLLVIYIITFNIASCNVGASSTKMKNKVDCCGLNANSNKLTNLVQTKLKTQTKMMMKITNFLSYFDEYSKITVNKTHLQTIKQKSKNSNDSNAATIDTIFAYYNNESHEMEFTENLKTNDELKSSKQVLAASGQYARTRFQTGWDKLNVKTFKEVNPIIQCWASGFIEGVLTSDEISYYFDNIHVFFYRQEEYIQDIKNFYAKIDKNLKKKISAENFEHLRNEETTETEGDKNKFQHWSYITCLQAQLNGLHTGYNIIADKQLDLLDFYFINSEGNFGDLKTFMKINKMKIKDETQFYTNANLQKIFNSDNIEKIWKNLLKKGHCSAIVKMVKDASGKYDMLAGHNTWSNYCEMLRTLKYIEYEFEGSAQNADSSAIGMFSKKINMSSYPGVLFSGDDFYELDTKIVILQTTLTAINRYVYKDILDMDEYIPEFMRIMITNFISNTGKEWVDNYKSYKNHMYITQWTVLDYNILAKINSENNLTAAQIINNYANSGLVYLLEEVPASILHKDISELVLKETYFGSFNLPYFVEHQKVLGLQAFAGIDFTSTIYNPRYYILKNLHKGVKNLDDFTNLIRYNGYKNFNPKCPKDPSFNDASNGISSRCDLDNSSSYNGGIDFKAVNRNLVDSMTIYAYGGPTFDKNLNLKPFDFADINNYSVNYHKGIPKLWNFKPFYFSKNDFSK